MCGEFLLNEILLRIYLPKYNTFFYTFCYEVLHVSDDLNFWDVRVDYRHMLSVLVSSWCQVIVRHCHDIVSRSTLVGKVRSTNTELYRTRRGKVLTVMNHN